MTTKEAALDYCSRGWSVIPIRFDGDVENKKRPLLDSWEPYQKQAASEEQVKAWWAKWPSANVGLVMGEVSGLVALDLDGQHAGELIRQAKVFLPDTATVQTSRGYHAIFQHPGYQISNRVKLLSGGDSGVDVRGDGGYVVAPPSIHGSGFQYRWVIPAENILPLPDGVAALLSRQAKREESSDGTWFEAAWRGVGDGQRNDTAARLAGWWLHITKGSEEATYRAMSAWAERCTPAMPLHELKTTIKSVARREAAKQSHEQTKGFTRHVVVEGPEWADQMRDYRIHAGTPVPHVPGVSLLGGLVPGRLLFLAGRPGAGKSTLACQLTAEACLLAQDKLPTWVVSTEMTLHEWGSWMAAYLNGSGTHNLPHPLPETILGWWRISPIAITDSGTIAIQDIRRIAESRIGLKLLIVDHTTRIVGGRKESRNLEVGEVARGLKGIAKDLKCTVVSLAQMNRRVEGADNARPRLSDLRDSGEIEAEADAVMFLWSKLKGEARYTSKVDTILTVEKNRHGKTGDIPLVFDRVGRRLYEKERT